MKTIAYIDGEFIDLKEYAVQLEDRGYQMGDGVFETLRVYDGKCFAVKKHLERYRKNMRELSIPITDTDEELYRLFCEMIEKSGIQNGLLYFQLTRGTSPRKYKAPEPSLPHLNVILKEELVPTDLQEKGVRANFCEDIRWQRCDLLTLNLLPNVLAMTKLKNYYEGIFVREIDGKQIVTEGTKSNVFAVKGGVLWTHPVNNFILNGVTRSLVVKKLAEQVDLAVVEKPFDKKFLSSADEIFLTSTQDEILPVVQLGRDLISDGSVGEFTKQLQDAYKALVQKGIDDEEEETQPAKKSFS